MGLWNKKIILDYALAITQRHFQQSLTTALAAMVWFAATDPALAQALRTAP